MRRQTIVTEPDEAFLGWLEAWVDGLPVGVVESPSKTVVAVVDMVNGFCKSGNLAGPRVGGLIAPIVRMLEEAEAAGVRDFLIAEDTHRPNDPEFRAFAPHCVAGSGEEETVEEIRSLPFADRFEYFPKPTINVSVGTGMDERLQQLLQAGRDTYVIAGDCTDLCVYQAASTIRFISNALELPARVLVPAELVNTYDLSIEAAQELGALPHPGDLMHHVFLYHMALIGCEVVSRVGWSSS